MIRVARIGHGIEQLVEAGNASAIFRWCIPFSADVKRIGGIGCADSAVGQGQSKLTVVPEIVDIADCRRPRLEKAIQKGIVRIFDRTVTQVIVIWHAVPPPADRSLPQMARGPSHPGTDGSS